MRARGNQNQSGRSVPGRLHFALAALLSVFASQGLAQTNTVPPTITVQPLGRTASVGDILMFSVTATGTPPFSFQWQFNGTNVPGATNSTLTLVNLASTQAGPYAVVVTNIAGSVTSSVADLTVQPFVPAWTFTPLYTFQGAADGASPGALTEGPDGNMYGITENTYPTNKHTIFRISPSGVETPIYTFAPNAAPVGSLIPGLDRNLYGWAGGGIFQITTTGAFTNVFSLGLQGRLAGAVSSIIQSSDGTFFGTTDGESYPNGATVFSVGTNGSFSTLYTFNLPVQQGFHMPSLLLGNDDDLYGVYPAGGATQQGSVFQLSTNGTLTTIYEFSGPDTDAPYADAPLLLASDGNIYGASQSGGPANEGTLFRIATNGVFTTLYNFAGTPFEGWAPGPLVQGQDGNIYGVSAGGAYGTLFRFTTNGVLTQLYTFTGGLDGAYPSTALVQLSEGTFYGATVYGGVANPQLPVQTVKNGAVFALEPIRAPTISVQPQSQNPNPGESLELTVVAAGTPAPGYQWQFDGTNIPGATGASLLVPNLQTSQSGSYSVILTNLGGSVTSALASVTVQPSAPWNYVLLHAFDGDTNGPVADGLHPAAAVLQTADGSFYGTTKLGGSNGLGSVFRATADGALATLYSFTGGTDGQNPAAALIQAADGYLYGTTSAGGTNNSGGIFRMTTDGVLTPLYSFTGGADGGEPLGSLVQGTDGNFYGTTYTGGANTNGTVFEFNALGTLTTPYSFPDTRSDGFAGSRPQSGLVEGLDGAFYGTAFSPGGVIVGQYGTVFSLTTNGQFTALYTFSPSTPGAAYGGLVLGNDGNFYGAVFGRYTIASDTSYDEGGAVFQMTPGGNLTTLYTFTSGTDGGYPEAALVQGRDGNFYGTTCAGGANQYGTIFRLATNGVFTTLYSFTNGFLVTNPSQGLNPVSGLIQGSDGNFYGTTYYGGTNNLGAFYALIPPSGSPGISVQPRSQSLPPGGNLTLSVGATGTGPLNYQWEFDGAPILGATNAALPLTNLTASLAGGYSVIVGNSSGSVTSSVARLPFFGLAPGSITTNSAPVLILGDIPGSAYRIDLSTDLSTTNGWTLLTNLTLTTSPVLVLDPFGPVATNRFYRAALLP